MEELLNNIKKSRKSVEKRQWQINQLENTINDFPYMTSPAREADLNFLRAAFKDELDLYQAHLESFQIQSQFTLHKISQSQRGLSLLKTA